MHAAQELVHRLDHRALTGAFADVEHFVAECVQHGLRGAERILRGGRHDGERRSIRADSAAGHGRINETAASGQHAGGKRFDGAGRAGRHEHDDSIGCERFERAVREQNLLGLRGVDDH